MIEVKNLVKRYGDHYAVNHLSFTVEDGQIFGFLGPNGAGKSTTMNIMTGYLAATEGQVLVEGHDILEEPEAARACIGYLPEIPPLYPDMTVEEYLRFCAELKKIPKEQRTDQLTKVLALTHLEDMSARLIRNLSKGYRQRVGLAQAILGFPKIIILDEPTVGLDPKQVVEIRDLIRHLAKDHTVILSSHILSEIRAVCDRVLIIRKGRFVVCDTPEDLEEKLSALRREKEEAVAAQDFEKAAQIRDIEQDYEKQMEIERDNWHKKVAAEHGEVTEEDIAAVVAEWTGVPVTRLTEDEGQKLLHMEETLHKRVVGQDEAVKAIARAIRRGRVGLKDPKRPIGSFLFLGPTGVGKTELCKALAEAMFGDENAMVRLDMSEYMERHTVSRLIGSPPGYVGHEEGGQLTEKVRRRPYSVVLFDEIEKAHEDVWNLLLQIMDDGELTDSQGRRVDFRNTVIVMTSNVGAKNITAQGKRLGFADTDAENTQDGEKSFEAVKDAVMAELKRTFRPEFLNRIDETIIFHPLNAQDIAEIARKLLAVTARRVEGLGISMEVDDAAVELVAKEGFDPVYGARPLRRAIQSKIEDAMAEEILEGRIKNGDTVTVSMSKEDIKFLVTPIND